MGEHFGSPGGAGDGLDDDEDFRQVALTAITNRIKFLKLGFLYSPIKQRLKCHAHVSYTLASLTVLES